MNTLFQRFITWAYCKYVVKPAIEGHLDRLEETAAYASELLGEEIEFVPDEQFDKPRLH